MCNDGRDGPAGVGFVCPNGTLFDQEQFACEFWNKVNSAHHMMVHILRGVGSTPPPPPKKKEKNNII